MEVWPLELQLHCTVSPGWIVTDEGTKQKQLGPTITVTVAALATVGQKTRSGAIVTTTAAMRSEEIFITTIQLQRSVATHNTRKVTRLLLLRSIGARDQCAVC